MHGLRGLLTQQRNPYIKNTRHLEKTSCVFVTSRRTDSVVGELLADEDKLKRSLIQPHDDVDATANPKRQEKFLFPNKPHHPSFAHDSFGQHARSAGLSKLIHKKILFSTPNIDILSICQNPIQNYTDENNKL